MSGDNTIEGAMGGRRDGAMRERAGKAGGAMRAALRGRAAEARRGRAGCLERVA